MRNNLKRQFIEIFGGRKTAEKVSDELGVERSTVFRWIAGTVEPSPILFAWLRAVRLIPKTKRPKNWRARP